MHTPHRVRVLIVDRSRLVAGVLADGLRVDSSINVVGVVTTPAFLEADLNRLNPQVVVLDGAMPGINAEDFMGRHRDAAVLVATADDTAAARAVDAGAADVFRRPHTTDDFPRLLRAIHDGRPFLDHRPYTPVPPDGVSISPDVVFALAAGPGGMAALGRVLSSSPTNSPGIVVVTSLPAGPNRAWVERLGPVCPIKIAADGDRIQTGVILVSPGDAHLIVRRSGGGFAVSVRPGPTVHHRRPSAEILFNSVAAVAGPRAVAGLLSGHGVDGVAGLLAVRKAGGRTIAQSGGASDIDAAGRAIRCGAAEVTASAGDFAATLCDLGARDVTARAA